MALVVYALCTLTSLTCAVLLARAYRRTRVRLLFWSTLCFAAFAVNNFVLILDVGVLTERDLSVVRALPSLAGIALLLFGLVWESDR
ncbi:MAG: DUF5985 family protein [Gemmatimonadaceae bacterium]